MKLEAKNNIAKNKKRSSKMRIKDVVKIVKNRLGKDGVYVDEDKIKEIVKMGISEIQNELLKNNL